MGTISTYPTPEYIRKAFNAGAKLASESGYDGSNINLTSLATKVIQYTARFVESNVLNMLRLWRIVETLAAKAADQDGDEDSIVLFALRKDGVDDVFGFEDTLTASPSTYYPGYSLFPMRLYRSLLGVRVSVAEEYDSKKVIVELRDLAPSANGCVMRTPELLSNQGISYPLGLSFNLDEDSSQKESAAERNDILSFENAGKYKRLLRRGYAKAPVSKLKVFPTREEEDSLGLDAIAQPIIEWVGRLAESYASDVLIDWGYMMNSLVHAESGDDMLFIFGIRDMGVDHMKFFKSRMAEAAKYIRAPRLSPPREVYRKVLAVRAQVDAYGEVLLELADLTSELFTINT